MEITRRIINGLEIFEKYNKTTIPYSGNTKIIMMVQEVEFDNISNEDTQLLNTYGWYNKLEAPYLWGLYRKKCIK